MALGLFFLFSDFLCSVALSLCSCFPTVCVVAPSLVAVFFLTSVAISLVSYFLTDPSYNQPMFNSNNRHAYPSTSVGAGEHLGACPECRDVNS